MFHYFSAENLSGPKFEQVSFSVSRLAESNSREGIFVVVAARPFFHFPARLLKSGLLRCLLGRSESVRTVGVDRVNLVEETKRKGKSNPVETLIFPSCCCFWEKNVPFDFLCIYTFILKQYKHQRTAKVHRWASERKKERKKVRPTDCCIISVFLVDILSFLFSRYVDNNTVHGKGGKKVDEIEDEVARPIWTPWESGFEKKERKFFSSYLTASWEVREKEGMEWYSKPGAKQVRIYIVKEHIHTYIHKEKGTSQGESLRSGSIPSENCLHARGSTRKTEKLLSLFSQIQILGVKDTSGKEKEEEESHFLSFMDKHLLRHKDQILRVKRDGNGKDKKSPFLSFVCKLEPYFFSPLARRRVRKKCLRFFLVIST